VCIAKSTRITFSGALQYAGEPATANPEGLKVLKVPAAASLVYISTRYVFPVCEPTNVKEPFCADAIEIPP